MGNTLDDPRLTDKIDTSSVAIADTMSFLDDRLLVTLGARRQTIEQTSFAYNTIKQSSTYDKSKTTPVAGVVYKFTPTISAYANYIEGLVKGNVAPGTVNNRPVTNAGEIFAPYQAKQKEVGVKYDGGTVGASAAFFTTDQRRTTTSARPTAPTASSATRAWSSRCSASPSRACACSAA